MQVGGNTQDLLLSLEFLFGNPFQLSMSLCFLGRHFVGVFKLDYLDVIYQKNVLASY